MRYGRKGGGFNKQSRKNKETRPNRKKRKTYSLFQGKEKKESKFNKRIFEGEGSGKPDIKRLKTDPEPEHNPVIEEDPSSDEDEDEVKKLLTTFNSNVINKKLGAIDSSSDSEELEEEGENDDCEGLSENEHPDNLSKSDEGIEHDEYLTVTAENEDSNDNEGVDGNDEDEDAKEDIADKTHDPFTKHLHFEISDNLLNTIQNPPITFSNSSLEWPSLGKLTVQIPLCTEPKSNQQLPKSSLVDTKNYASFGMPPTRIHGDSFLEKCHIKSQIVSHIAEANKPNCPNLDSGLNSLQCEIFSILNNYQDFLFTERTFDNAEAVRFAYSLHVVNHILKTRLKIVHHNVRLADKDDVPEEFRDQGLVRPKILIIVPFRDAAYRIVNNLIQILIPDDKGHVLNKKRFIEEYTGHEIVMPKKNPKPEDYESIFSGNTGDDFRIGITVTKKSLKLFAEFYSSDIIIASPLGLRTVIGAEGEPDRNYDFLASIELLIMDQAELFLMQNWDHVLHIFNHLHLHLKESHGTDFTRVRTWSLNGWAKYYRQTVIVSSIALPEINAIINKRCFNYAGKVKTANPTVLGSICQVFVQLPHVFRKFTANSVNDSVESRFKFFVSHVLPQQQDTLMKQTVIFVSNYFDFVRLRNYFKREDVGFVQICEYSKTGKVARARDMFFHGDAHFLLYTERYHFFNRIRLKGIRHLVFYQPPNVPHFYYEMCNLMQEGNMNKKVGNTSNMTVTVLYSKYDILQLAAVLGTERAMRMVQSDRNVHMLVTDSKNNFKDSI